APSDKQFSANSLVPVCLSTGMAARSHPPLAQPRDELVRLLRPPRFDQLSRCLHLPPQIPQQNASNAVVRQVIDDPLVKLLQPILDGFHSAVDFANRFLSEIEQIRVSATHSASQQLT